MPYYKRASDVVTRRIDDELVLVPIRRNLADLDSIYTLNPMAADVWDRLDAPQTAASLAEALTAIYEVDTNQAMDDVTTFLVQMIALDLVETSPHVRSSV